MMKLAMALAATTLLAVPAAAQNGNAYGKDPKVCLITFESAEARASGADTGIVKAQYLPFRIAQRKLTDTSTQALAYYGFGALDAQYAGAINFYYPDGSSDPALGVTETSDTETLCEAFAAYADSRDDDDDSDD